MSGRSLLGNVGSLAGGRLAGDFFAFLLIVVLARRFGPEGNGAYGFAMSVACFFAVVGEFGLRAYSIRP